MRRTGEAAQAQAMRVAWCKRRRAVATRGRAAGCCVERASAQQRWQRDVCERQLEVEGGRNNDDGSAVDTIDGDRGSGSYYRWKRVKRATVSKGK
jgi:hypothetical protein